ncbi:phage regulatory CII family protein [Desulfovulcanus sp.]
MEDLKNISLFDAINMAVAKSGYSRDEIGALMGWTPAATKRIFSTDNYWPSLPTIPKLCSVLGNSILVDWLKVHTDEYLQQIQIQNLDAPGLVKELGQLFKELGDVALEGNRAVEDGQITTREARRIIKELYDVANKAMEMIGGLRGI